MTVEILTGDAAEVLRTLQADSVQCVVTSPPYYGLRSYDGGAAEIGREATPEAYVARLVETFREVRRVLRPDGTVWLNLGDCYAGGGGFSPNAPSNLAGSKQTTQKGAVPGRVKPGNGLKPKDLLGMPWQVAFALRADGWFLRSSIVWAKPNPMPESVRDRPTQAYELVFLLTRSPSYFYDAAAIAEPATVLGGRACGPKNDASRNDSDRTGIVRGNGITRNARNVWTIAPKPYKGAHFAVMPEALVERCVRAGTRPGDVVLDPFGGSGTVGAVAQRLGRSATLIDLNPAYCDLAASRVLAAPVLAEAAE